MSLRLFGLSGLYCMRHRHLQGDLRTLFLAAFFLDQVHGNRIVTDSGFFFFCYSASINAKNLDCVTSAFINYDLGMQGLVQAE